MSLLATLFNFRSRDATGTYPLQSAGSKEYLLRHRLESQASICNSIAGLFNENLLDPHATDPSTTLARFAAMVAGSVSAYFKHKLILLQRLSDWRGPIAERLGETATIRRRRSVIAWSADPRRPVSALLPIGCGQSGDSRPRAQLNCARNLDLRSGFTGRPTYLTREATASNLPSARSITQRSG